MSEVEAPSTPTQAPAPTAPETGAVAPRISKESVQKARDAVVQKTVQEKPKTPVDPVTKNKAGYDEVDFNVLPEEHREVFKKRFDRIYGQMKHADLGLTELRSHNNQLSEQLSNLIQHQETQKLQGHMGHLQNSMNEALNQGRFDEALKINREMLILEAKGIQVPQIARAEQPRFSGDEGQSIMEWADQRPWASKDSPLFDISVKVGKQVMDDQEWGKKPIQERLAEIDRRMSASFGNNLNTATRTQSQVPQQQAVLSGNPNIRQTNAKAPGDNLTGEQKEVARKSFRDLPVKEAYAAYERQLDLIAKGKNIYGR